MFKFMPPFYEENNFIHKLENAHSQINSLIEGNIIKNQLRDITGIKDMYSLGRRDKGFFQNNLIDALVGSIGGGKPGFEELFQFSLGGEFGKGPNPWATRLAGSKGNIGFDLSKLF
jgi:hypothetical protein